MAKDDPSSPGDVQSRRALVPAQTDPARARALRDERVDHIVSLMANGWWEGARSSIKLAAEWGVTKHAVGEYAREASGIVRRLIEGDPGDIKAEILAGLEHIRVLALAAVKIEKVGRDDYEERRAPDLGSALRAYELRAKMLGIMIEKHEISGELHGLSEAELDARLAAAIKKAKGES